MSNTFVPVIANKSQVDQGIQNAQPGWFVATDDTHEFYIHLNGSFKKYSDVVIDTYSNITSNSITPLTGKLYFATDTHQLLQAYYEPGASQVTWKVLNDGGETSIVDIVASGNVSKTLKNNTIYYITGTIGTIDLSVDSEMSYCTLCFTAGANTTFTHIEGSRCIGHDCSGGQFTPVSGKEYQIAIDKLNNILTLYVLRLN